MLTTRWVDPSSDSAAWLTDYRRILEVAEMRTDPMPRHRSGNPAVFAFEGEEALGVALGHVSREGFNERFGEFASLPGPQAMLDKLAVVPAARGRGIGQLLVREFAAGVAERRCTHVALLIDQSTPAGERVGFFLSCGFRSLIEGSADDLFGAEIATLLGVA